MFEAGFAGRSGLDPAALRPGPDPAADFAATAAGVLRHWRSGGPQAMVSLTGPPTPSPIVYRMMVGEFLVARVGPGRGDRPADSVQSGAGGVHAGDARRILLPQYRGEAFGPEVPVPDDATPSSGSSPSAVATRPGLPRARPSHLRARPRLPGRVLTDPGGCQGHQDDHGPV
jgi:hypothetical protein